jgi:hypothetical protein
MLPAATGGTPSTTATSMTLATVARADRGLPWRRAVLEAATSRSPRRRRAARAVLLAAARMLWLCAISHGSLARSARRSSSRRRLKTELSGVLQDEFAVPRVVAIELKAGLVCDQRLKQRLALDERKLRDVPIGQMQRDRKRNRRAALRARRRSPPAFARSLAIRRHRRHKARRRCRRSSRGGLRERRAAHHTGRTMWFNART